MPSCDFDCAVIGGGPGGLVSTIYLRRFMREVILINSGRPRASWIPRTRNLVGFHQGISGPELLRRLNAHVEKLGAEKLRGQAIINTHRKTFELTVGERIVHVRKVILATGMRDLQPELPNLAELRERGLLRYCPVCDAFEYRDEPVTVLACGEHGIKTAMFMARYTDNVSVVLPESFSIAAAGAKKLKSAGVRIVQGSLMAIEARQHPKGVWLHVDGHRPWRARVAYVALGSQIEDSAWGHLRSLRRNPESFLVTGPRQKLTIPGLYAVGDCVEGLAQIAVAAGQAAVAATAIHNDLRSESD